MKLLSKIEYNSTFSDYDYSSKEYLSSNQLLTYIGNKRKLLGFIGLAVDEAFRILEKDRVSFVDVFSGTGVVSRYMKQKSSSIISCDLELYSFLFNSCYLSNISIKDYKRVCGAIDHVNNIGITGSCPGIISENYAPNDDSNIKIGERVFYTSRNALFIDNARMAINDLPEDLKNFVLGPLLYMSSVHVNTSGVFKGFHKDKVTGIGKFGGTGQNSLPRICKDIVIPYPSLRSERCEVKVMLGDSNDLVRLLPKVDVAYLDPPYNQHPYGSNYFMLNVIANNSIDSSISKVSGIPTNWNRSLYNKKKEVESQMRDIVSNVNARFVIVSYNSDGFIGLSEMISILEYYGSLKVFDKIYNTFRGCRSLSDRNMYVSEYLFLLDKF